MKADLQHAGQPEHDRLVPKLTVPPLADIACPSHGSRDVGDPDIQLCVTW